LSSGLLAPRMQAQTTNDVRHTVTNNSDRPEQTIPYKEQRNLAELKSMYILKQVDRNRDRPDEDIDANAENKKCETGHKRH
jgi:hypothetical protein